MIVNFEFRLRGNGIFQIMSCIKNKNVYYNHGQTYLIIIIEILSHHSLLMG